MTTQEAIKQELVVKATRAKVWQALTTPEGWTGWFSDGVEGDFQVGSTLTLDFGDNTLCYGLVVEREELKSFAYKWHPGEDCAIDKYPDDQMTTVRFSLEDHADGTLIKMVETGFENIPIERRQTCTENNTTGWRWELGELAHFVDQDIRQSLAGYKIVRERIFKTSPEALWDLIATPEGMKKWWVKDVDGEFTKGELAMLFFEHEGQEIKGPLRVVESKRPEAFAFLSEPGPVSKTFEEFDESQATTTTFTITPTPEGAHLKVVESGYDNVPKPGRIDTMLGNSEGWTMVMDMIERAVG